MCSFGVPFSQCQECGSLIQEQFCPHWMGMIDDRLRWWRRKEWYILHTTYTIWVVVSNIFYVHPYLGKIPIVTNIFEMGWNHQLAIDIHSKDDWEIDKLVVETTMFSCLFRSLWKWSNFTDIISSTEWIQPPTARICDDLEPKNHQTFQVPKMEIRKPIQAVWIRFM